MNERVREIRKNSRLTQTEFGNRLGVTPAAISGIESGTRNLTEQMLLAICREFGANESWLRHGAGDMFRPLPQTELDALLQKYGLNGIAKRIVEQFVMLDEAAMARVVAFVVEVCGEPDEGTPPAPATGDKMPVPPAPARSAEAEKPPPESGGAAGIRSETAETKKAAEAERLAAAARTGELEARHESERLAMQKRLDEMQAALGDTKAALDGTKAALDAERLEKAKLEGKLETVAEMLKEANEKILPSRKARAPAQTDQLPLRFQTDRLAEAAPATP